METTSTPLNGVELVEQMQAEAADNGKLLAAIEGMELAFLMQYPAEWKAAIAGLDDDAKAAIRERIETQRKAFEETAKDGYRRLLVAEPIPGTERMSEPKWPVLTITPNEARHG